MDNYWEEYLGDGVYCTFDGYHIWVWAAHAPDYKVAFEPRVLKALNNYAERIKELTNG